MLCARATLKELGSMATNPDGGGPGVLFSDTVSVSPVAAANSYSKAPMAYLVSEYVHLRRLGIAHTFCEKSILFDVTLEWSATGDHVVSWKVELTP